MPPFDVCLHQKFHNSHDHHSGVLRQIADGLALKRGVPAELTRFLPIFFSALTIFLPVSLKVLVMTPKTAPTMVPAARTITVTDKPYFLKISLILALALY